MKTKIYKEYLELALFPDEYKGTEDQRLRRLRFLILKIKSFRFKSIRNFLNQPKDNISIMLKCQSVVSWEAIDKAHQLTVNGECSPWVSKNIPAEVGGYMAFYKTPHSCRIIRFFEQEPYRAID